MGKFFIVLLSLVLTSTIVFSLPINEENEPKEANGQIDEVSSEKSTLKHSPFGTYQDDDDDDDEDEDREEDFCPICRDDFLEDPALDLVCGHKYHLKCLSDYHMSTNHLGKCFLCMKELIIKGSDKGLKLTDYFYREQLNEVVRNKLKIGIQAARTNMPSEWKKLPDNWLGGGSNYY